jgi:hypothetical protein
MTNENIFVIKVLFMDNTGWMPSTYTCTLDATVACWHGFFVKKVTIICLRYSPASFTKMVSQMTQGPIFRSPIKKSVGLFLSCNRHPVEPILRSRVTTPQIITTPSAFWRQKYFPLLCKNTLAFYNGGVVAVNSEVVGLAFGITVGWSKTANRKQQTAGGNPTLFTTT